MKKKDKKKIQQKIRRNENLEMQKEVDLREKVHVNKKKYNRQGR